MLSQASVCLLGESGPRGPTPHLSQKLPPQREGAGWETEPLPTLYPPHLSKVSWSSASWDACSKSLGWSELTSVTSLCFLAFQGNKPRPRAGRDSSGALTGSWPPNLVCKIKAT